MNPKRLRLRARFVAWVRIAFLAVPGQTRSEARLRSISLARISERSRFGRLSACIMQTELDLAPAEGEALVRWRSEKGLPGFRALIKVPGV